MKIETAMRPDNWLSGLNRSARVDDIIPAGFEGYLRIFHKARPAEKAEGLGSGAAPGASWGDIASALGRRITPETVWADVSGAYGEPAESVPGLGTVYPPEEGRLDAGGFRALARVLAQEADGPFLAAFWIGWDPISTDSEAASVIRRGDTVVIQGEQYVLYSFDSGEMADVSWMGAPAFGWAEGNGLTPNYLWPADGSWCLGTNIDLDSSILGGPERVLSEVESLPELEALRVTPSTDLASSVPKTR